MFAAVDHPRLAHSARRWIGPEGLVIGAAVVVTGEPESPRRPENQQRRREPQQAGPPRGPGAEPAVGGAEQLRRIEWRQVGTEAVMVALERRPGRIDDE